MEREGDNQAWLDRLIADRNTQIDRAIEVLMMLRKRGDAATVEIAATRRSKIVNGSAIRRMQDQTEWTIMIPEGPPEGDRHGS